MKSFKQPFWTNSSILSFRTIHSSVEWPYFRWYLYYLIRSAWLWEPTGVGSASIFALKVSSSMCAWLFVKGVYFANFDCLGYLLKSYSFMSFSFSLLESSFFWYPLLTLLRYSNNSFIWINPIARRLSSSIFASRFLHDYPQMLQALVLLLWHEVLP